MFQGVDESNAQARQSGGGAAGVNPRRRAIII
jgi:hypothetical protein